MLQKLSVATTMVFVTTSLFAGVKVPKTKTKAGRTAIA